MAMPGIFSRKLRWEYSTLFDLNKDDRINREDLILFMAGWKDEVGMVPPMPLEVVREMAGGGKLKGNTWTYECLGGGILDCEGETRTVTGGPTPP